MSSSVTRNGVPTIGSQQPAQRIAYLYRQAYGREPQTDELALGQRYLKAAGVPAGVEQATTWEKYAQVILLANEFVFID